MLAAARHRFKYLSYAIVGGSRLEIDLWKSAPPPKAAEIRRGPGGCLALDPSSVSAGLVTASGRARGVFENQFPLVLCGSDGTLIAQRTMHVSGGRWSGQLTYNTSRAQAAAPAVAVKVLARYPQSCLRSVPRPGGVGRVAMLNTGTLTIASPAGGTPTVIPYTTTAMGTYQGGVPLVAWSSDGR